MADTDGGSSSCARSSLKSVRRFRRDQHGNTIKPQALAGDDARHGGGCGARACRKPGPEATTARTTTGGASTPPRQSTNNGPEGPFCSSIPPEGEGSFDGMADDPVATAASNNPYLTTLTSAVQAAGLVDTFNGGGPFTVFAPNNEAPRSARRTSTRSWLTRSG